MSCFRVTGYMSTKGDAFTYSKESIAPHAFSLVTTALTVSQLPLQYFRVEGFAYTNNSLCPSSLANPFLLRTSHSREVFPSPSSSPQYFLKESRFACSPGLSFSCFEFRKLNQSISLLLTSTILIIFLFLHFSISPGHRFPTFGLVSRGNLLAL